MLLLPSIAQSGLMNGVHWCEALEFARSLPSNFVHCVVTSPPYFGLRSYIGDGDINKPKEIGLEDTPVAYIAKVVALFREIRRVLRDDGTLWVNMGDSYSGGGFNPSLESKYAKGLKSQERMDTLNSGLPPKSLMMMPARLAIALQDDGWILRAEIVWHKINPMPESVTDRPTKSHEMVYLLAKSERYFYDQDAIREPHIWGEKDKRADGHRHASNGKSATGQYAINAVAYHLNGRNRRDVWAIASEAFPGAHFATFPTKLIEPMILAGCPEKCCVVCGAGYMREVEGEFQPDGGLRVNGAVGNKGMDDSNRWQAYPRSNTIKHTIGFHPACACNSPDTQPGIVYDPFMGSGTTALVARRFGRRYIGSELSPEYVAIAKDRLRMPFEARHVKPENRLDDLPMFAGLTS